MMISKQKYTARKYKRNRLRIFAKRDKFNNPYMSGLERDRKNAQNEIY